MDFFRAQPKFDGSFFFLMEKFCEITSHRMWNQHDKKNSFDKDRMR